VISPVHVIAEAGTNHDGDPDKAALLIDIAKRAGADSVKFQIIYPETLYTEWLWSNGERERNPVIDSRRAQQLTDLQWTEIAFYASERGIQFSASVFDERGIALLTEIGVPYLKIASTDLNNGPLLRAASHSGLDLFVSTGLSNVDEIREARDILNSEGSLDRTTFLHCVSEYPCPESHVGLDFLEVLWSETGRPVGYSDHTLGNGAAAAAVALGAVVIEKHFTHDRQAEGFDHHFALEEPGLAEYIRIIRQAADASTPKPEKLTEAELEVARRARRGVYASRDINAGESISERDILIVRPPSQYGPNDVPKLIGQVTATSIRAYEAFIPAHFK
jgi:N,N'-diacetyllegionaminate synthase